MKNIVSCCKQYHFLQRNNTDFKVTTSFNDIFTSVCEYVSRLDDILRYQFEDNRLALALVTVEISLDIWKEIMLCFCLYISHSQLQRYFSNIKITICQKDNFIFLIDRLKSG